MAGLAKRVRELSIVCAVLMVCGSLVAQEPIALTDATLVVTKAGYFLLSQDADGNPTLKKFANVIKLGEAPDQPTDPTDPPAEKVFRTAVTKATGAVQDPNKANAKKALATLYRTAGQLPVQSAQQLKEATDVIYNALKPPGGNLSQAWDAWKAAVEGAAESFADGDADKTRQAWQIIAEMLEGP